MLYLKGIPTFSNRVDFAAEEKGLELYCKILMTKYVSEFQRQLTVIFIEFAKWSETSFTEK